MQKKHKKDFKRIMSARGVKPDQKENIIKVLCPHMKERSRSFWHNLEVNNASFDLIHKQDEDY